MSFTTIKNGVDERLTILRHDESGFYNISATSKLIHQLKHQNAVGDNSHLPSRGPRIAEWFRNKDTTQLFASMSKYLNEPVEDLKFEISGGANQYRGTYVHPKIYDHFVAWLDKDYAVLISIILEKFHADANRKIIQEKDCKIDKLQQTIEAEREEARKEREEQRIRFEKLMAFGEKASAEREDLKVELHQIKKTLIETKDEVKYVAEILEEKSFTSTKNPNEENLHHYALIMTKHNKTDQVYNFRSGQSEYIDSVKQQLLLEGSEVHTDKFYQANGIDYRRNVQYAVNKCIEEILEPINSPIILKREALAREIEETNKMLVEDINQWNADLAERVRVENLTTRKKIKLSANGKRYYQGRNTYAYLRNYEDEKRVFEREIRKPEFVIKGIPIKVCATYISWKPNKYISKAELESIFDKVNAETQASPYSSDEN